MNIKTICTKLLPATLLLAALPAMATDYYWIDGAGDWTDISHWRMDSSTGAIPLQAPTQDDNVYFDANSGFTETAAALKTVTISGSVTCRDIIFDGCTVAPTVSFTTVGATLNIYGSSVWQAGMSLTIASPSTGGAFVYQDTGTPKTITTNDVALRYIGITINETSSVSLQGNLIASGTCGVTINAGTFNANDFRIDDMYSITANSANAKTLNLGSSVITCFLFYTNNPSTTVHAGTSTIRYTGNGYLTGNTGQQFNNVIFESPTGVGNVGGGVNINHLEFRGTGAINQNNTIGDLVLTAGKTYSFTYGTTQTITNSISGGADCAWTTLKSSDLNQTADPVISVSAGASVNLTGIIINGVNADGTGAPVTLNNSVDGLGDATGWNFAGTLPSQDLYWVGGAGNWSDIAHWSFTSGGAGSDCVPGPGNNVFFDAASGFTAASDASKTVTLNEDAHCRDITFAGFATPPILKSGSIGALNIFGSSTWQAGMTVNITGGTINYQNTGTDKTITSNGVTTTVNTINIYETASISLNDDFTAKGAGAMFLYAGTFNTNDHNVTTEDRFYSYATQLKPVTLNLGSSTLTLAGFSSNNNNQYTTVDAGTSHIHVASAVYRFQAYGGQHFYNVTLEAVPISAGGSTAANPVYINELTALKGTGFIGFFDINTLTLAPGYTYALANIASEVVTVNESFTAGQDCAALTVLNGKNGTLSMPAGATVGVHNVMIQNSKATGGADFTANNSVDNGGNSGWSFTSTASPALYWVGGAGDWNDPAHWSLSSGGAGGACVPGMGSDVFFDAGSGFTDASKTVTVAAGATGYCRNVTVDGSAVPPIFTIGGTLNIYGSSVWQAGMTIGSGTINYQNTGTPKTITSNGVVTGSAVNMNETSSVRLTDDFSTGGNLFVNAGTFNTENHNLTTRSFNFYGSSVVNMGSSVAVVSTFGGYGTSRLNLDSSQWTVAGSSAINNGATVTTGESTITATGANMFISSFGQPFYNVVFNNPGTITNNSGTQDQTFNSVVMKKGGTLNGNNTYGSLYLMGVSGGNVVYNLQALKTQTVTGELVMMGTTCGQVQVISTTTGTTQTKANLKVEGETTSYNWVDMSDIDASTGLPLNLGTQGTSTRNLNVNYDASGPIVFSPFPDWTCHGIVAGDADSYIIKSDGFYGNSYSKYVWTDSLSNVIGTSDTLNILNRGYGTYFLTVTYYNVPGFNKADSICVNTDSIVVYKTPPPSDIYSDPGTPLTVCTKQNKVTVAEGKAAIHGQNVKWHETDGTPMDDDTELKDGEMYQVTQTMVSKTIGLDCESFKVNVYVKLVNCNNVYINPGGRMRVMMK